MHVKRIQRGPFRAYSHVRGHLRVSRVCLDRPGKKTARSLSFSAPLLLDHVVGWRLSTDVS